MSPNDHALVKAYEKLAELAEDLMLAADSDDPTLKKQLALCRQLQDTYDHEHDSDMWLVIYEPSSGDIEVCRQLEPNDELDAVYYALEYAAMLGVEIEDTNDVILNIHGDIRVEFRRDPDNGTVIWSGQSFYFKREE